VRQISKVLDLTESAVKQRLRRGREKARELYEPEKTIKMEVLV
jgi:DNA-directed RNA polymerase specialized sigma24 family protein